MSQKNILIVTRSIPDQVNSGSGAHMLDLIKFIKEENFKVHLLVLSPPTTVFSCLEEIDRIHFGFDHGTVAQSQGDDLVDNQEQVAFLVALNNISPYAVIVEYEWLAGLFDVIGAHQGVKRVIFLHDLRTMILPSAASAGIPTASNWDEAKEADLLQKADAVLCLQNAEEDIVRRLSPSTLTIRIGISGRIVPCDVIDEVEGNMLFVGSRLMENSIPLRRFIDCSYPMIKAAIPHAHLSVCGGVSDLLQENATEDIRLFGVVDDLSPYYAKAQLVIVPHVLVGGMKLKFVGALLHGRAIVASRCGIEGFPEAENSCALVSDKWNEFSLSAIRLLSDRVLRQSFQKSAASIAFDRLSPQSCYGSLIRFLNS